MKLYYYAHTGHKKGLDRLKKATALLKKFNAHGVDTMLLVNDFRAGLVAKEFGIRESVTIETILDIDAIAQFGDVVIIDSPEDDRGRLEQYCTDYKQVFRFAQDENDTSRYGETMIELDCDENDEACISGIVIDDIYFEEHEKVDRTLFFLGDSDADKTILSNADFFENEEMELLLGHYFYVKYEDDLAKIFKTLHEPEEYSELICNSKRVVTSSLQCALEARISGANVIFIDDSQQKNCSSMLLEKLQILTVDGFNKNEYKQIVLDNAESCHLITQKTEIIASKIINNFSL
ncbi:MAG: hypothetical protein K0U38_01415 [Epsilonproteobacteria bacterium]|nr:hypothetical protein [Campylobacterota bacterium]